MPALRPRALVIDDDPLFRSLLVSMLRKDFLVSVAGDGTEGYYKALQHPPHLAVIDIQMPGWDGLRTLKAFRSHQALAHIPIMMLTADSTRTTVLAAIQNGANDYVIKTSLCSEDFLQKAARLLAIEPQQLNPTGGELLEHLADEAVLKYPLEPTGEAAAAPTDETSDPAVLQALVDNWE